MKLDDCCYRAIKHGYTSCPVCGQVLIIYGPKQTEIVFKQKQR